MRTNLIKCLLAATILATAACDKKKDDLVEPFTASSFPQVITFDEEGDGELEDEDKFSFKLKLNDRVDPEGNELGGKIVPLTEDVTVAFEIGSLKGFTNLASYIKDVEAFYEPDDCTKTDITIQYNVTTGKGTVVFPKGVEEIEVEFETDDNLFDDNIINTAERSLTVKMTGLTGGKNVVYNTDAKFKYEVLDDEGIHNKWELDHTNATEFAAFKALFGLINDDVKTLTAAAVNEITISIEYGEVQVEIELKATETVTECGVTSIETKVIEIEAGIEELSAGTANGDIEFAEEIEQSNGTLEEFVYEGKFAITGNQLKLTLEGEYDGTKTAKIIINLVK